MRGAGFFAVVALVAVAIVLAAAYWVVGGPAAVVHEPVVVPPELEATTVSGDRERAQAQAAAAEDPPEVRRLRRLVETFRTGRDWSALVAIGDVYRKGAFPRFLPNEDLALRVFRVAAMCPCGAAAGTAQIKYIEARQDAIDAADKAGAQLPTSFGQEAMRVAEAAIRATPQADFEKPRMQGIAPPRPPTARRPVGVREPAVPDWRNVFDGHAGLERDTYHDMLHDLFNGDDQGIDVGTAFVPPPQHMHDTQNVHDHSVVAVTRTNLENLGRAKAADVADVVRQISAAQDLSEAEVSDALTVLKALKTEPHDSFDGRSERDVLDSVWARIQAERDPTLKRNLVETLGKQLASGVENGHVVCSTGRVTRLMGTFDGSGCEGVTDSKPIWAVKEELATLAARVRDDVAATLSDAQRAAYDRGDAPDVDERMAAELTDRANKTYCDELGMSRAIIEPMVQMYADAF